MFLDEISIFFFYIRVDANNKPIYSREKNLTISLKSYIWQNMKSGLKSVIIENTKSFIVKYNCKALKMLIKM